MSVHQGALHGRLVRHSVTYPAATTTKSTGCVHLLRYLMHCTYRDLINCSRIVDRQAGADCARSVAILSLKPRRVEARAGRLSRDFDPTATTVSER